MIHLTKCSWFYTKLSSQNAVASIQTHVTKNAVAVIESFNKQNALSIIQNFHKPNAVALKISFNEQKCSYINTKTSVNKFSCTFTTSGYILNVITWIAVAVIPYQLVGET